MLYFHTIYRHNHYKMYFCADENLSTKSKRRANLGRDWRREVWKSFQGPDTEQLAVLPWRAGT